MSKENSKQFKSVTFWITECAQLILKVVGSYIYMKIPRCRDLHKVVKFYKA